MLSSANVTFRSCDDGLASQVKDCDLGRMPDAFIAMQCRTRPSACPLEGSELARGLCKGDIKVLTGLISASDEMGLEELLHKWPSCSLLILWNIRVKA